MASNPPIDKADIAATLKVLSLAAAFPHHPGLADFRSAVESVNRARKARKQLAKCKAKGEAKRADKATLAATVTGSRHDDETAGLTGVPGKLHSPNRCYVCRCPFVTVHWFYHRLCPGCAETNYLKRSARADLSRRTALVTGGRAKIGMHLALMMLRDGAHVTITTRFPADAARRFASHGDYHSWRSRLVIVGIDLRDPRQVLSLAAMMGPTLDILVNNAAQTIRRSVEAYGPLMKGEDIPLDVEDPPEIRVIGRWAPHVPCGPDALPPPESARYEQATLPVEELFGSKATQRTLPSKVGHDGPAENSQPDIPDTPATCESVEILAPGTVTCSPVKHDLLSALQPHRGALDLSRIDAGGLLPGPGDTNTWSTPVGAVPALEMLEVQLCNSIAPFLLLNALRPALASSPPKRKYVVNATAMEGMFSGYHRSAKTPNHPHTNMAKAALNMLTRTSACELAPSGIYVTSVDTGWITDERAWSEKVRAADNGFTCPLDLVDGAARLYDPIVRGERGEDLYGVLLKDYAVAPW